MTKEELWKLVLRELELEVSKANFATWFQHTLIADHADGRVTIGTPSAFVKEWLENKYQKPILKSLRLHAPDVRGIEFSITSQKAAPTTKSALPKPQEEQLDFRELYVDKKTNLNPRYTFENFIVGTFNELASACAHAIVKSLGTLYNPLFIYGGVGLGKTHLLQAIGNKLKEEQPAKKIYYVSAERFANELVSAIRNNETPIFKDKYRSFDVLIIDDIQFISNRTSTQEEVFHTFNTMYELNKQIVFSSDRPPKSIQNLEERLRSRFEGGMIADISEPDYETRLAILQTKASQKQEYVPNLEILEYIASVVRSNIRELEGALNTVVVGSKIKKRHLSLDEVKNALSKNTKPKKILHAGQIIQLVARFYDVPEKYLFEKTRRKEVVRPRQVAMYLLREDFNGSYPYIGQKFGGRDHTTAIHACVKIARDAKKDERLKEELKLIREQLYEAEK
ncbi:chromosomal replication initiator protein DnaA [Patescibacteria group bacterium]|nr:chromosomal replication initiator protein DnaA [Patescibacteria group bacterium]